MTSATSASHSCTSNHVNRKGGSPASRKFIASGSVRLKVGRGAVPPPAVDLDRHAVVRVEEIDAAVERLLLAHGLGKPMLSDHKTEEITLELPLGHTQLAIVEQNE